jgi:hypothetical protein
MLQQVTSQVMEQSKHTIRSEDNQGLYRSSTRVQNSLVQFFNLTIVDCVIDFGRGKSRSKADRPSAKRHNLIVDDSIEIGCWDWRKEFIRVATNRQVVYERVACGPRDW